MSNGKPIKDILAPVAAGLVHVYYERVNQSSSTQRGAVWAFNHWDVRSVPEGYTAEVSVKLKYTGNGLPPQRRKEDRYPPSYSEDGERDE